MATSKGKAKARSRKLAVKKQAVKDLQASRGKGPKGGSTRLTSSNLGSPSSGALNFSTKFQKV